MNKLLKSGYLLPLALLMVACGGQNNESSTNINAVQSAGTEDCASIEGHWELEHVVVNDTVEVRPADINPDVKLCVDFNSDSTFNFQTGCNVIGGRYALTKDSITLSEILITEMACEDMRVEEMLCMVLPRVVAVDRTNDSIVRLNTRDAAYIVLKKSEAD